MDLSEALVALRRDDVLEEIPRRVERGQAPLDIVAECRDAMVELGNRFARGDVFLAELVLAGEILKAVVAELDPLLARSGDHSEGRGRVVLATPKGDIHDIGKGIVAMMLKVHGFEVHDLGVDVDPRLIVAKVEELQPQFVGMSALLTTALTPMKEVADTLIAEQLRDGLKLLIGGGVTTAVAMEYVGADFQTTDVMKGVHYCLRISQQSQPKARAGGGSSHGSG